MRRLYYLLPFAFVVSACCNKSENASFNSSASVDLTIETLVEAINTEQTDSKRQNLADQITLICRYETAKYIGKGGIDAIASLLEDEDEGIRFSAAKAIGYIGSPAKYTTPLLRKALDKENEQVLESSFGFRTGIDSTDIIPGIIKEINQ